MSKNQYNDNDQGGNLMLSSLRLVLERVPARLLVAIPAVWLVVILGNLMLTRWLLGGKYAPLIDSLLPGSLVSSAVLTVVLAGDDIWLVRPPGHWSLRNWKSWIAIVVFIISTPNWIRLVHSMRMMPEVHFCSITQIIYGTCWKMHP